MDWFLYDMELHNERVNLASSESEKQNKTKNNG